MLPVYVIVRVLVAAYIFMTGYGHFCYFYDRTSSSWLRLAQVLLRVNIYTMFLCIAMSRTYLFYYFVPLTTFWFLMVRVKRGTAPGRFVVSYVLKRVVVLLVCLRSTPPWPSRRPGIHRCPFSVSRLPFYFSFP